MKINPNAPTHPIVNSDGFPSYIAGIVSDDTTTPSCIGLTIRQQFAMAAMQGLLSNPSSEEVEIKFVREYIGLPSDAQYNFKEHYPMYIAKESAMYADALIAELNRTEADNV